MKTFCHDVNEHDTFDMGRHHFEGQENGSLHSLDIYITPTEQGNNRKFLPE